MKQTIAITLLVSLILLAGCSQPGTAIEPTSEVIAEPVEPTIGTPQECENPLYPVRANAYWRYTASGSSIGTYDISHTISAVSAEGFTVDIEYSTGVSVQNNWTCSGGDLLMMDAPGGPAGSLASSGGTFATFETEDNSGISLPGSVVPNDEWEQSFHITGDVQMAGDISGTGEGIYSIQYMAMGTDTVAVPAGTFEALLVQAYAVYDLTVTVEGMEVAVPVDSMIFLWYAEGVGLVKSEVSSSMGDSEVIELTSYFIP